MKWTTSWAMAASNVPSGKGRRSAERLPHVDAGVARADRGDERLGGVDGGDGSRPEPRDQLGRERAGAAADIEHPLAGRAHRRGPPAGGQGAASTGP